MMTVMAAAARSLGRLGEKQISSVVGDRAARAFMLEGAARAMALEANAHLVTELRLARLWPARCPMVEDDGA